MVFRVVKSRRFRGVVVVSGGRRRVLRVPTSRGWSSRVRVISLVGVAPAEALAELVVREWVKVPGGTGTAAASVRKHMQEAWRRTQNRRDEESRAAHENSTG